MCKCNCKRLIEEIDIFGYRGLGTLLFMACRAFALAIVESQNE